MAGSINVMNDELADVLLKLVADPAEPPMLRARAAIALGPVLELADTDGFESLEEITGIADLDDVPGVPITEPAFDRIRESLRKLYEDTGNPKEVRRRVFEAAIRAPQLWHTKAIQTAYASGDPEWKLTAVFAMRWVKGFDAQILESLKNPDLEIQGEAVEAAGNWELKQAWPHIAALVKDRKTPKSLLLAAIGAVGNLRPKEAPRVLAHLMDSPDEEIAEAVEDALAMADFEEGDEDF
jgi:HEAT repeat protein